MNLPLINQKKKIIPIYFFLQIQRILVYLLLYLYLVQMTNLEQAPFVLLIHIMKKIFLNFM